MKRKFFPMDLQLFAGEGEGGQTGEAAGGTQAGQTGGQQANAAFDYEKLAGIITGKQNEAEATILKNYFRQQGLSREEAEAAINTFKEQKRANEPDVEDLQDKLAQANTMARDAIIEKEGILLGIGMGLDAKSVPYVLKMADVSKVIGEDGKVNEETFKNAINQVLEDVPALKPKQEENTGIHRIGSGGSAGGGQGNQSSVISGIFGNAK